MLRYLCGFLYQVSEHNSNRMNVHNLSVVFTPNIVRPAVDPSKKGYMSVPDSQQSALEDAAVYLQQMGKGMVLVQLLIAKHQDIFE
jgi:Flp pilus assembly secretin CpaC